MILAPIVSALNALLALALGLAPATATVLVPYYAPPFASTCTVHAYDEGEIPDLSTLPDDPLCVEYAKRDITLSNGGAIAFLVAEPARFAAAGGKCAYWQQDHWSVQGAPGQVPVIRWDGSYWWDLGAGRGGARLTGLTIGGQPATLTRAAQQVAPYSPQLAAYFLSYANGGDGAGVNAGFPFNPQCAR